MSKSKRIDHNVRSSRLSRRTFLRGAGTAVALPFLETMLPRSARAQTMSEPRRMLAYYVPNGMVMNNWTPGSDGANYALSPILAPLAPVKEDVLVLTGLANRPARPDGFGDHAAGTGSFLTVTHVRKTEGADIQNAISVDQVAANALAGETRFPSLQLGSEGGANAGDCDSGYSCAYARSISWSGETTPLGKEVNPRAVFERLFAGIDPEETASARAKRRRYKQSILDFVRSDATTLKGKVSRSDQAKLDEYLTGVRELEQRLMQDDGGLACDPGAPPGRITDIRDATRAMSDLMVLAFQCDLTRVISYMLGNAGSGRVYGFLGIRDGHHQISHHQNDANNLRQLTTIDTWEIETLAYLLGRMKSITEGNGRTMLENSVVFFSSEIEDGNSHSHFNMPIIVAGSGGGTLNTGRHIRYGGAPSVGQLFISLLATMGVNVPSFGDANQPLDQLT